MPRENTQHQNVTTINSEDATTEGDSPSVRIAGLSPREFAKRVLVILLGSAIVSFGVHNIHNVTGITEGGIIGLVLCFSTIGLASRPRSLRRCLTACRT